jgi:hypothetical protein
MYGGKAGNENVEREMLAALSPRRLPSFALVAHRTEFIALD